MRLPVPSAGIPLLLAGLLLATGSAAAGTGAHASGPPGTGPTGEPSPAPTAASQAATLAQMTGLSPQQIATRPTCAPPAPGQASCDANIAVLRSSGALVRPRVHPQQALADVQQRPPGGRLSRLAVQIGGAGTAGAADISTGQPAPAAGTPAWLQQAYDLSYLSATQGAGDTIAVIDAYDDPTAESDLGIFRSTYGLPACTTANGCFRKVNEWGYARSLPAPNSGWEPEEALDLDAVSSLCPNCHIILVEASSASESDLAKAMATGVALGANQLSNSWSIPSSKPLADKFTWSGVATVAATGDYGYDDHLNPYTAPGDVYPAATPGVTAVGGTTLAAADVARGYGEAAWSSAGSGCDTAEPKPFYQSDPGCTGRSYADVSADADPETGLGVYDSGSGGWVLVGGTSLATPLIAAGEAVTGVAGATPQWAYTDQALLNDPVSGSNGPCAASIFDICNAGVGYDGPTGMGSMSGQLATGGPGVGGAPMSNGLSYAASVTATSASMVGGVYPNGSDTTYWWQYGPTTAYGQATQPIDVGSGTAPVPISDTLSGLTPSTTYHYRLVATNSAGTTYGYDYALTTASDPSIPNQTASSGSTTSQSQSATAPWLTTSDGSAPVITPTTTSTTPAPTMPPPTTPVSTPPPTSSPTTLSTAPAPVVVAVPRIGGTARVGAVLRVTGGDYRNGAVTAVRFERCSRTCLPSGRAGSASHTLTAADAGYFLRARVTVSGPGGVVSTWATGLIGPIRSRSAGAAVLAPGTATIRGSAGRPLAWVVTRRSRVLAGHHASVPAAPSAVAQLTRVSAIRSPLRVWVCVVARGAVVSCTAPMTVRGAAGVRLTLRSGQRAELIAVARP
jgi:hypothetical protein